jgi:putative transposase
VRREHFGKWSVFFQCDLGAAPAPMAPASIVGVDVGLRSLAVTSDGEVIPNPRHAAKAAAKLARIQRVLARRKKGSRSRERALVQVAKAHQHIRNQRLDTARKVACQLVSRYDVIAFEQLVICRMVRGNLAKSIHDAGWGVLLRAIASRLRVPASGQ